MYRKDPMTFTSQDIDPNMCTHLIYSFAGLEGNQIVSLDTEEDIENGGYTKVNRVVNFLYKGVKTFSNY